MLLPLTIGCIGPAFVEFDEDGDGLTTSQEVSLGTSPAVADMDGDGFDDGEEVGAATDPLDPEDHPYFGGWTIDTECRDTLQAGSENVVGQVGSDWRATDQFGETLHFYDFCNHVVALAAAGFT